MKENRRPFQLLFASNRSTKIDQITLADSISRRSFSAPQTASNSGGASIERGSFQTVVVELQQILGKRLVAYLIGVKDTKAIDELVSGARDPDDRTEEILRLALRAASFIAERDGVGVAKTWFQGLNPQLDDNSPARFLSEAKNLKRAELKILAAARSFVVDG